MKFINSFRGALGKFRQFFYGRYGQDGLNRFISCLALILCAISFIVRSPYITLAILALLAISIMRSLSKNHVRRRRENQVYEKIARPAKRFFKYWFIRIKCRKTHRVYSCGSCHSILRIPKSAPRGTIEIKCTKCGGIFTRRQ